MLVTEAEAGPSRISAADKWVKPNGPPVEVPFGARLLTEDQDVWTHNTWDHVTLPEDFQARAAQALEVQKTRPVPENLRVQFNSEPERYWDNFYSRNKDQFFKDRSWLRSEFPELIACSELDAGPKTVLEVGCGAGNSIFTLMKHNENADLKVWATDYSAQAIEVVKENPMYPCPDHGKGKIKAAVWDITSSPTQAPSDLNSATNGHGVSLNPYKSFLPNHTRVRPLATTSSTSIFQSEGGSRLALDYSLPDGLEPGSVDIITVIFCLSALHPREWDQAIHNFYTALKPGGLLLFRDYGRHDLTQLRIKHDRLLDPDTPNLYIRGDGTRVYFFEKEEVDDLLSRPPRGLTAGSRFDVVQLEEDRRMNVNRKLKLQMFRIWVQAKARKRALDESERTLTEAP